MSEDGTNTKSRILDLFADLDETELDSIEQWICSKQYKQGKTLLLKTLEFICFNENIIVT